MQRYERYKPSGVAWLGQVPEHWKVRPGFTCFKENKDRNKGLLESTVLSLSYGRIVIKPEEKLTGLVPESFDSYQLIKPGDIVIRTTDLQNDQTSLRVGYARDKGMITSAYLGLRCQPEINPEYVYRLLASYDALKVFYGMGSGLRQNIDFWDFKRLPIPLPPRNEQDRIVAFLDQKTTEIDAAISKKERLIELLIEQKMVELNQSISRGMDENAKTCPTDETWLPEIPCHWKIVPLLSIADVIDPNPSHRNPKYTEIGFPFVSTVEFAGDDDIRLESTRRVAESTVIEQELRCNFSSASIAFSRKGTIGAVRRLPLGQRLALLDSLCVINVKDGIDAQFIYRQLATDMIESQYRPRIRGAALKQLSVGRIRTLKVLLPPMHEQEKIARYIDSRLEEINKTINRAHRQIDQLTEFRDILISHAVTGRLKI